ncbi:MAG TPA: substrate-binding domain-containing protein [Xanthobacteraceae bacterium]|jgi:ribose transport system substrate-binding protein|nr:substrate-binding domain-containing protein [Xanthobacteraceae bacterium]
MKCDHKRMRYWALPIVAAAMFALAPPVEARDAKELMLKSVGTTENVSPVIAEAIKHAAMDLTPDQRKLAIQCWKNNVCETGHGNLTVAYADGFGENVWRQVTKMEFIAQALTYPSIKKIVYTSAGGDATKAISDMRAYIAQKVDVIVIFADAGPALLPTVKEATEAGILVVLHNGTYIGGKPGKDFVTTIAEDLCALGTDFVKMVLENSKKDPTTIVELGGTPGNGLSAGWQKCSEEEIAKHKNLKLLGKADTNWTQEGSFKAMSGFLAQYGNVDAVLFEYADGFRGGLRAYDAAKKAPDLIVSLRTDEMGVICDWEKANDPNFKIFYSNGQNDQARFALTAAMMKKEGKDVPPSVNVPFRMHRVVKGLCNPAIPESASLTTLVDNDMMKEMFAKP